MAVPRLAISEGLRAHMGYRKFRESTPRMLVLRSEYWLDWSCIAAGRRMGWTVEEAKVMGAGLMPRDMIARFLETLVRFQPDFLLSINLGGMDEAGMFAQLFSDLSLPLVTWFVDDPRTIMLGKTCYGGPFSIALTWERAYETYLKEMGFAKTAVMPLAVDTELFDAEPLMEASEPPMFVGNSMVEFSEGEWKRLEEQNPWLATELWCAFEEGRVTRENFATGLSAILGEKVTSVLTSQEHKQVELICFVEATKRLREGFVQHLSPEGMQVYGDEFWRRAGVEPQGYLDYRGGSLAQQYRNSIASMNTTSVQMASAVNQRVFDCPAAGGFLITDAQSSLQELFEEDEVVSYSSLDECIDKLRFYRNHPNLRFEMAQRMRQRVLQTHRYEHRLNEIATIVQRVVNAG